jgi:hypothetical protein
MKIYKPYEPTLLSKNLRSFRTFIKDSTVSRQPVNQQVQEGSSIKIINNTNNKKGDCS